MDVNQIPIKAKGDPLLHSEVNALVDAHKYAEKLDYASRQLLTASRWPIQVVNETGEDIPPYSLFGLSAEGAVGAPVRISVDFFSTATSGGKLNGGYFTNGESIITSGNKGLARAVQFGDVCVLKGNIAAGNWCGPTWIDGGTFELNAEGFGFLSLGASIVSDHSVVVRTAEPIAVMIRLTTPVLRREGRELGEGSGRIWFRDLVEGDIELVLNNNLSAVTVYNSCDYDIIPPEDGELFLQAVCCLGVGLVLVPCAASEATSSSSSSSSSYSPPSESGSGSGSGSGSESASSGGSDSSSGSGSVAECFGIDGIDFDLLPVADPVDVQYVLGINTDGCLVRIPVSECP